MKARLHNSRGQLFLVGAIGLVITLVALTVLLNGAIYAENLASRGTTPDLESNPSKIQDSIDTLVEASLRDVNENMSAPLDTSGEKQNEFVTRANESGEIISISRARNGQIVTVESVNGGGEAGIRILQDDPTRRLRSNGGADDWVMLHNQSRIAGTEFYLQKSSLQSGSSGAFTLVISPQTTVGVGYWTITIYESGSDVVVDIESSAGTYSETCTSPADASGYIDVSISEGKLGDTPCEYLKQPFSPYDPFALSIENGNNARGTYNIYVPNPQPWGPFIFGVDPSGGTAYDSGAGNPRYVEAHYSQAINVRIVGEDFDYQRQITYFVGGKDGELS